ncbi:uncharacterized protein [Eleutherodactylus coqui]|uniref:uncharacterized protein n=1 Tax=Eleutherodactylus coqui TaxID=57060 RepID=UPI00346305C7
MAPAVLCCIGLQLFLLSSAQPFLSVDPVDPVVPIGASIQLNCSINCPLGRVAWKGLDIHVNKQYITPGYSVQTFQNITVSMEGLKFCEGGCPGHRSSQKSVELHVYALPKTLLVSSSIKHGVRHLHCAMQRVYPPPNIRCYRGSDMLGETTDITEVEDEGNLYNVTWSWVIPEEDGSSETSYRCEAQVLVKDQLFTREGTWNRSKQETTTEVAAASTSQITSTPSQKPADTMIGSQPSAITEEYTKTPRTHAVTPQRPRPTQGLTKPLHRAQPFLSVDPVDPVVPIGASIQLNCSINCPLGRVAWKGLDIHVNKQYITPGYSVQTFQNITVSMEGLKFCEGGCPGHRSSQKSVELHVYALPKTLLVSSSIKHGVRHLHCAMQRVYPPPNIRCYRGSDMLGETTDITEVEDEGNLYNVTWSWVIPEEDGSSETSYRCEAQVLVKDQLFTREGTWNRSKQVTYTPSWTSETSYVTTNITASPNPQTTQLGQQMSPTGNQPSTILSTATSRTTRGPNKPSVDGPGLLWTLIPASGLLGSFLLSLQIYRQLSKKGFFKPNHMECPKVNKDAKSQEHLQEVFC